MEIARNWLKSALFKNTIRFLPKGLSLVIELKFTSDRKVHVTWTMILYDTYVSQIRS